MKESLRGKHYASDEGVKTAGMKWIKEQNFYMYDDIYKIKWSWWFSFMACQPFSSHLTPIKFQIIQFSISIIFVYK